MTTLVFLSFLFAGCGDDAPAADAGAGFDAGPGTDAATDPGSTSDAGGVDSGPRMDAGTGMDAGMRDSGTDSGPTLPTAVATISDTGEDDSGISGTVTFTQEGTDVTVVYELENCPDGDHQTHLHAGTGCGNRADQGMHWGPARGESIPNVTCADGTGSLTYTRDAASPDTAWTIGGPDETNIVGHPVVIHGSGDTTQRIGCGVIELP